MSKGYSCGTNVTPQCLHFLASRLTSSRQSGQRTCVSGVGSSGNFLSDGKAATTRAKGPKRQPSKNQPQPLRSLELAMTMQTMPKRNQINRSSIDSPSLESRCFLFSAFI